MNEMTKQQLKILKAQHLKQETGKMSRLKVYYGFSKINKIQKREAIQVSFENEQGAGSEKIRKDIADKLKTAFLASHIGYQEPRQCQELEIPFST